MNTYEIMTTPRGVVKQFEGGIAVDKLQEFIDSLEYPSTIKTLNISR